MPLERILILIFPLVLLSIIACNYPDKRKANIEGADFTRADSIMLINTTNEYAAGKLSFEGNCRSCHFPPDSYKSQLFFKGLFERVPAPAENYLIAYLSDSESLRNSGNTYAQKIHAQWNSSFEHKFKGRISTQEFAHLFTYIKIASKPR